MQERRGSDLKSVNICKNVLAAAKDFVSLQPLSVGVTLISRIAQIIDY